MNIEKQCCTLRQAKRLKELGVEQISYFIWGEKRKALMESWTVDGIEDTFYSAYTVAELGIMLPDWILRGDIDKDSEMGFAIGVWPTSNLNNNWGCRWQRSDQCEFHPSESIARTSLLIQLIENKLITVQEINTRLMAG